MADVGTFDRIAPAPITDLFGFDFSDQILKVPPGTPPGTPAIVGATWTCAVAPISNMTDPSPQSRIVGVPTYDATHTVCLVGNMLDQVNYLITATVTVNDGRVLSKSAEVVCLAEPVVDTVPVDPSAVPFDYDSFVTSFPEFAGASADAIRSLWDRAGLILRNDGTSEVDDLPTRKILLNLLTAHLAQLFAGPGGGAGGMVGRINSKSVNGVSLSAEGIPGVSGTQAWYLMTRYGTDFWRATAAYRQFIYVPGPERHFDLGRYPRGPYW